MAINVCWIRFKWCKVIYGGSLLPRLQLSQKHHLPSRNLVLPTSQSTPLSPSLLSCWTTAPRAGPFLLPAIPHPSGPSLETITVSIHVLPLLAHLPRFPHWPLPLFPSFFPLFPPSSPWCWCLLPACGPSYTFSSFKSPWISPCHFFKKTLNVNFLVRHFFLYLLPAQAHKKKMKKRNHK